MATSFCTLCNFISLLRTVPPFVPVHVFCTSRYIRVSQGICPPILQYFCANLSKAIRIQKKKIGGNRAFFSERIELKLGKKLRYILCILKVFSKEILWLLYYLRQKRGYPHFSFWTPITLANIYFFRIVITFANVHLH